MKSYNEMDDFSDLPGYRPARVSFWVELATFATVIVVCGLFALLLVTVELL